ncbi:MAG: helix-turn-helix domain-containing protein [Thermoleophilia bacterium]
MFDIGSSLCETRTRLGFDFAEMEFRTKVRAKYLRALEAEEFDQLPGHTYTKGFLRTYAESLGMDGQLYVDEYNVRYVSGDEDMSLQSHRVPTSARRHREHRESRLVVIAVIVIILLTALVIAAWRFGDTAEPKVQGLDIQAAPLASASPRVVSVEASRGASFVVVRAAGTRDKPLYRGILERGQVRRFAPQRLTITLKSPLNVVVRVAGVRVKVPKSGRMTIQVSS